MLCSWHRRLTSASQLGNSYPIPTSKYRFLSTKTLCHSAIAVLCSSFFFCSASANFFAAVATGSFGGRPRRFPVPDGLGAAACAVALGAPQARGQGCFFDPPEHLLTSFHTVFMLAFGGHRHHHCFDPLEHLTLRTPGHARRGLRRAAGAPHGAPSPGRYSHSDTTLYIIS